MYSPAVIHNDILILSHDHVLMHHTSYNYMSHTELLVQIRFHANLTVHILTHPPNCSYAHVDNLFMAIVATSIL